MKNLKVSKLIKVFVLIPFFLIQTLFAQALSGVNAAPVNPIKVISPIAGNWANKQMLIIDTSDDSVAGCEYFYSINGSDPATFGFAYDGPVVLDVEGSVILRIVRILPDQQQEQLEVRYSVTEDYGYDTNYYNFVDKFINSGIVYYNSGDVFSIPENLLYNLNNSDTLYSSGTNLSLDENNIISRFVPVTILDNQKKIRYHFVMKTLSQSAGIFSRRDVPFKIQDWNTIVFTDENLLFKIDDEFWQLPKENREIDRSVSHMISWQSLNFEAGNPVEFFILPPEPEILEKQQENGAIVYTFDAPEEDEFTMSLHNDSGDYQELYTQIGVDTFEGDKLQGKICLDIFSNSVYQGTIEKTYSINKGPVQVPVIRSTAKDFYSHNKVQVWIEGDSDDECALYVAVCDPMILSNATDEINPESDMFDYDAKIEFKKITENKYTIELDSVGEGAAYYKILAYSSNGEKSSMLSEYSVVVDEYNYYFDVNASSGIQNGTIKNPFTSFDKCLEAVNSSRSVCIHVNGDLIIPEGKNILTANCEIKTKPDSTIIFEPGSSLVVQNATLSINNTRIQNKASASFKNIVPLLKLENSVLELSDSLVSAEFFKNGTVIDSVNSVVNIKNCIASVNAQTYASFISCMKTKLNLERSTINSSADTSLIISANDGDINIFSNSMKLSGRTGRIAEFFGSNVTSTKNSFKATFNNNGGKVSPIYLNKNAKNKENNNEYMGF